jgi:hypothetical protein
VPTVTRLSCMASRSAACVLGGVRLISSARIRLWKMGPARNRTRRRTLPPGSSSSWSTSVPVMSAGRRSGVNWTRPKDRSSALARDATSSVLASPGTPTRSACPRARSATSMSSITSPCPTTRAPMASRSERLAADARSSNSTSSTRLAGEVPLPSAGCVDGVLTLLPCRTRGTPCQNGCTSHAVPVPSAAPSASAGSPTEQIVRPPEGLARGVWEAPAAAFYAAAGALFVACGLYAARRAGLLSLRRRKTSP